MTAVLRSTTHGMSNGVKKLSTDGAEALKRGVSSLLGPDDELAGEEYDEELEMGRGMHNGSLPELVPRMLPQARSSAPAGVPKWKDLVADGTSDPSLANPSASVLESTLAFRRKAEV